MRRNDFLPSPPTAACMVEVLEECVEVEGKEGRRRRRRPFRFSLRSGLVVVVVVVVGESGWFLLLLPRGRECNIIGIATQTLCFR